MDSQLIFNNQPPVTIYDPIVVPPPPPPPPPMLEQIIPPNEPPGYSQNSLNNLYQPPIYSQVFDPNALNIAQQPPGYSQVFDPNAQNPQNNLYQSAIYLPNALQPTKQMYSNLKNLIILNNSGKNVWVNVIANYIHYNKAVGTVPKGYTGFPFLGPTKTQTLNVINAFGLNVTSLKVQFYTTDPSKSSGKPVETRDFAMTNQAMNHALVVFPLINPGPGLKVDVWFTP